MKQPILRFSVKPVAFHDVTKPAGIHEPEQQGNREEKEQGNGDMESGNGEEQEKGRNEREEKSGNEGEAKVETEHVTETKIDWTHDEDANTLIKQLGMTDPRDSGKPSDDLDAKPSKKAPNSGKSPKPKDKKKGKPSKPSKRGTRSSKSDDDSEEWGKPWKRKRVGGSARSRRMVSNNQTGQSAYMCL